MGEIEYKDISELDSATPGDSDLLVVSQNGNAKKVTMSAVKDYVGDKVAGGEIFIGSDNTSYNEIAEAINASKVVILKDESGNLFHYCGGNKGVFYFVNVEQKDDNYPPVVNTMIIYPAGPRTQVVSEIVCNSGAVELYGKLTLGAAPTADMDAATKKYVDDAISAAISDVNRVDL